MVVVAMVITLAPTQQASGRSFPTPARYTTSPAAVPEPGILALLGMGIARRVDTRTEVASGVDRFFAAIGAAAG